DATRSAAFPPHPPLRSIPGKRGGLLLVRLETGKEAAHRGQEFGSRAKPRLGGPGSRSGQCRRAEERRAAQHDSAAIGCGRTMIGLGHGVPSLVAASAPTATRTVGLEWRVHAGVRDCAPPRAAPHLTFR